MSRGTISSVAVLAFLLVNAAVSSPLRKAEHSTSHRASHHLTRADAKAAALQSRINEYDKRSGVERQLINRILKENKRTISKSDAEALNKFIASSQNILADIAKYSGPNLDAMEEVRESMLAKIKQIDTKLKERRLDLKKASTKTELNAKSNSTSLKASDKELNSTANKTALASDAKVSKESSQTANNETKPAAAADRASKVLEDILTKFKKLEERVEKKGKERDLEDKKAKEEREEKERKEKDDKERKEKDDKEKDDKKEKDAAKEAEKNKERKISDKAKEESKVAANKKANEPLTPDDDSPRSAPTPPSGGGGGGPSQSMFNNGGGGGGLPTWNMQPQTQQMMGMTMTPDGRSDLISGYASQDANSLKQVGTSADRALDSLGNGFIDGGTLNGNMMGGQQQMMGGPTGVQQPMEGGMDQGMEQTQSFGPPSSQGAPSILGQSSENLGEQENFDQMQGGMEVAGGGAPEQFEDRGHDQGQTEEMYGGGEEIDEPNHHHHHHHGHHHRGHHHDDAEEAAQIAQQFLQPGDQGTGAAGYEMSQDTQQEPFMHEARGSTTEVFDAGRGHGPSMGLLTGGGFVNSKSPSQLGVPQAHDTVPQFGAVMGAKTRAKTPAAVLSSQPNGAPPLLDRSRGISGFGGGQSMIQGKPAAFSLPPGAFMGPTQVDPADKLLADLQQKQLSSNEFEAMMNMNRQRMMSDGMSGFLPQSGQPGFPGSPGYGAPRGMEFTDPNMGRSMGQQISDVVGQAPGVARGMARSFGQGAPLPVAGIQTGMQPGYGPMFGPTIGMNPFGGSGMLGGKFKKDKVKKRANRRKKKRSRVARLSNRKQNKRSRVSRKKNKRGHIAKQHKRRHISRRQDKMDRDLVLIRSL